MGEDSEESLVYVVYCNLKKLPGRGLGWRPGILFMPGLMAVCAHCA